MGKKKLDCNKPVKAALEVLGYHVAKVEHWNAFARIRQDMFGWVDFVAVRSFITDERPLFLQVTSRANISARIKKAKALPVFEHCSANAECYVVGCDKADGKIRLKWVRINGEPFEEKPE